MSQSCYEFVLEDMVCSGCYPGVDKLMQELDEFCEKKRHKKLENHRYYIAPFDGRLTLWTDETDKERVRRIILDLLEAYQPRLASDPVPLSRKERFFRFLQSPYIKAFIGLFLGVLFLALSFAGGAIPVTAMIVLGNIAVLFILYLGWDVWRHGFNSLTQKKPMTMDTLFTVSTLTMLFFSLSAFITPAFSFMFDGIFLVLGFRYAGVAIKQIAGKRMTAYKKYIDRLPKTVLVWDGTSWQTCELEQVSVGDIIKIEANSIIPLDGILKEPAKIYDTLITGGFELRDAVKDEALLSGMRLSASHAPVTLEVTKTLENSYLAHLDRMLEETLTKRGPAQESSHKLVKYFTVTIVVIAVIASIIAACFFTPFSGLMLGASIISGGCPCTLSMVEALALRMAMNKAAEQAIYFKSPIELERAAGIDVLILDIDGTVNIGESSVASVHLVSEMDESSFIAMANALEENSPHRIARTLKAYARQKNLNRPILSQNAVYDRTNHSGVEVQDEGVVWTIGNTNLMEARGVHDFPKLPELSIGESVIYLAKDGKIQGFFVIRDVIRNDVSRLISEADKRKIKVCLCSGAEEEVVFRYADHYGISRKDCAANQTAYQKLEYVQSYQKKGFKVAMGGDSDNDSLALAAADFSMVIQSKTGSIQLSQKADVILPNGSLMPFLTAILIAKQMRKSIRYNLIFSLSYNISMLIFTCSLLFLFGFSVNPGICAGLMVLQMCLVLAGLLYFRYKAIKTSKMQTETKMPKETYTKCYNRFTEDGVSLDKEKELSQISREDILGTFNNGNNILSAPDSMRLSDFHYQSENPVVPVF